MHTEPYERRNICFNANKKEMISIMIFGTGNCSERVESILVNGKYELAGYLEKKKKKHYKIWNGYMVFPPKDITKLQFDYIIIATIHYSAIIEQLINLSVPEDKIISYYTGYESKKISSLPFINNKKWERNVINDYMDARFDNYMKKNKFKINNLIYEMASVCKDESFFFPRFYPIDYTFKKIVEENASVCRFGDGEFSIMSGENRPKFQLINNKLSKRLCEIIKTINSHILICIADNYGSLEAYTDNAADAIRQYMTAEVRKQHRKYIDISKIYHDAYITRPYILRKDKKKTKKIFDCFKSIWNKKDIVIVEGEYTRMGVGNDLFDNVNSIKRVLVPSVNAFDKYDEILEEILKFNKKSIVLISVGPTATVLAYDLACRGYQALDIGHLDLEYEWYLMGTNTKVNIPHKYVNEVCGGEVVSDCNDENYISQIVSNIGS